jgi:phosphate uptake regulator
MGCAGLERVVRHGPQAVQPGALMHRHFHEELETLKQTLLAMGDLVEEQIRRVMHALLQGDDTLALVVRPPD